VDRWTDRHTDAQTDADECYALATVFGMSIDCTILNKTLVRYSFMLQLMREDATEARSSDVEPTTADQQTPSLTVTDAGTEAPSSSTVAPSTSLNSDEIANGYRYSRDKKFVRIISIL